MVTCRRCVWGKDLTKENRLRLSQENKEIVNTLERRRMSLNDFCYCEKLGYIESRIMKRYCEEYLED